MDYFIIMGEGCLRRCRPFPEIRCSGVSSHSNPKSGKGSVAASDPMNQPIGVAPSDCSETEIHVLAFLRHSEEARSTSLPNPQNATPSGGQRFNFPQLAERSRKYSFV
jgi:hypothetical protein